MTSPHEKRKRRHSLRSVSFEGFFFFFSRWSLWINCELLCRNNKEIRATVSSVKTIASFVSLCFRCELVLMSRSQIALWWFRAWRLSENSFTALFLDLKVRICKVFHDGMLVINGWCFVFLIYQKYYVFYSFASLVYFFDRDSVDFASFNKRLPVTHSKIKQPVFTWRINVTLGSWHKPQPLYCGAIEWNYLCLFQFGLLVFLVWRFGCFFF